MLPVIIAGGSGSRLWPMSRTAFPKQFLALGGHLTLIQQTAARLDGIATKQPIVVCNEEHRFLVAEQMRQQGCNADILLEPVGRNTAPAIALAAIQALRVASEDGKPPVMLILAADHVIQDTQAFQAALKELLPAVEAGKVGTLGIVPTEPATGYGYIQVGDPSAASQALFSVKEFVEKPDLETAQRYMLEQTSQGTNKWLWNSGMFMIRADRYLEALNQYRPDIFAACEQAMTSTAEDLDFVRVDAEAFKACPDESIDYAIMEPLSKEDGNQILVTQLDAGWSDVGSWSALWDIADKDETGNAVMVSGDVKADDIMLKDTSGCFVSAGSRLVATLGVEDLVIIDTPDALLVAGRDKVQNIKAIVDDIKQAGRSEHHQHSQVYRPWGKYESVDKGQRYQVKRITVKPGARLSVQKHHHRAEHWIVVSGTARVTNGEETFLVTENQSTYIPIGEIHCLENPGIIELEMIEVQSGSYLGEDDIVRIKDVIRRK